AHKAAGVEFVTHTSSPDDIDANIHDLFITSVGARPRLIPIDGDRPAEAWEVNESLATSHPGIFAAGDCAIVTAGPYALDIRGPANRWPKATESSSPNTSPPSPTSPQTPARTLPPTTRRTRHRGSGRRCPGTGVSKALRRCSRRA